MSARVLALGVVEQLKVAFGDPTGVRVGYQPSGDPPLSAPPSYTVVRPSGFQTQKASPGAVYRRFGVAVILTHDLTGVPKDRQGFMAAKPLPQGDPREAMLDLAEKVPDWLLGRYDVLAKANAVLGTGTNGFIEPFSAASCGAVEARDGRLRLTITLTGAGRIHLPE